MSATKRKGQASMIDIMVLGLFISIMIVSTIYTSRERDRAQTVREESAYTQSMLNALMDYRSDSYGYDIKTTNFSFAEAATQYFCGPKNESLGARLNKTAGEFLNRTIRPGYDYIFFTSARGDRLIKSWNKQEDACAQYIQIVSFGLKLDCDFAPEPALGIWPDWKKLPRASEC